VTSATTPGTRRVFHADLESFASEIGPDGPIRVVGGGTAANEGGSGSAEARVVHAPVGIRSIDVAEMTVRVAAGTSSDELSAALDDVGQEVALGWRTGGTVGGCLAVGWSGLSRPRLGPARDALLEADVVDAWGRLVRCGGPTVKNVTGYDLCRLLVGSLGTLASIGEVLLRTRPRPAASRWSAGEIDPTAIAATILRPACHLWDGTQRWVLHEGHPADVETAAALVATAGGREVDGPPELPAHRWSVDPATVAELVSGSTSRVVAEVGIGTLHCDEPQPARDVTSAVRAVHDRLVTLCDPHGRLNPGRDPLDR
jgi:FAD/FMN-containing dehydrogenase